MRWEPRAWEIACWAVLLLAALLACGSTPTLVAKRPVSESPQARISLTEIDGDILKFLVQNTTPEHMLILRDEITMQTQQGTLRRDPGGIANVYNVPPYGAQDVNVKFDVNRLQPGEVGEVNFSRAVLLSGRPIPLEPILVQRQ